MNIAEWFRRLPNGLPANYLDLPQEKRNRLFVEMYNRERKAAPEKFKPYCAPEKKSPMRIPYPPDDIYWAWPEWRQAEWLRWRDAEERRLNGRQK